MNKDQFYTKNSKTESIRNFEDYNATNPTKKSLGPKFNKSMYLNIFYIRQILIYKKDKMFF